MQASSFFLYFMATYAIGDVQGCHAPLQALLERILKADPTARFIFVGDLINRGPQSLTTLRTVHTLSDSGRAQVVLGNHDLHLLAVAHGIRQPHRSDTLHDILQAPDCEVLLDWLRRQPLACQEEDCLLVHAGVLPQWSADQALALAGEVVHMLRSEQWVELLRQMYGNAPRRWDDRLVGMERLRCIVNGLTRLRFCQPDGSMEFAHSGSPEQAPPGFLPWFEVPGRKTADETVVFGHWSALGVFQRPGLIGLDSGCVWGGQLTAVCLEDRRLWQEDCNQSCQKA